MTRSYRINFAPYSNQLNHNSFVEIKVESVGMDETHRHYNAVIDLVAGEHSNDEWLGESFNYKFDLDGDGATDGVPNYWVIQKSFRSTFLDSDKYSMDIQDLDPA